MSSLIKAGGLSLATAKQAYQSLARIPGEKELRGGLMELDQSLPCVQTDRPYLTPGINVILKTL
jgi:hypothetical protein